jgi:hypothetical protein
MVVGMIMAVVMVGMIARLAMLVMMVVIVPMIMAMLVMVVIVLVSMRVLVVMPMIVTVMIMAMVIVMMSVVVLVAVVMAMPMIVVHQLGRRGREVSAAFRIERRFDLHHAGTEPAHHLLDDMVAADAQRLGGDLRRQMTVAEMPGDAHEMRRVLAADFDQRLGRGDHLDQAAVFQHQRIATAQGDHLGKVEQEFQPARAGHGQAPPMPVVEFEHDRIGGSVAPRLCGFDGSGA